MESSTHPSTSGRARHTTLTRVIAMVAALLLAAFTAPFVSPATASASTPQTWTVLAGNQSPDGAISGTRFLPGSITIDAGDTVTWEANSLEPHTVTFLANDAALPDSFQFNPGNPADVMQTPNHVYDGSSYYNSGILNTVPQGADFGPFPPFVTHSDHYSLMFPATGTFIYYCLVHGAMMMGTIIVQPAGTAYPMTPAQVDQQAAAQARAIVVDGNKLRAATQSQASMTRVMMGADDGLAMVMRFMHPVISIKAGTTVTFDNTESMGSPHTVTFGPEPQGPALETYRPVGTYDGTGGFSSFVPPGLSTRVTFTQPGVYHYVCALHDFMGMTGTVIVQP